MSLIRESRGGRDIAERTTESDQAGGKSDACLPLIAVW
jgi:hypothetical protein